MKIIDWRTFNYWAEEHYSIISLSGSREECLREFKKVQKEYPTMQYATIISFENSNDAGEECQAKIKRFKTKELLRIHHDYPPTYVREGKVL